MMPRAFRFVPWLLLFFFRPLPTDGQTASLSTGIEGTILIGPAHGGPVREGEADSRPLANASFAVINEAGAETLFTTDASGHFKVPLAPGRYSIRRQDVKMKFPRCGPWEVQVNAGGFMALQWECDSGMR
jgi:hypothetical protein